jgi:hypothetical protein
MPPPGEQMRNHCHASSLPINDAAPRQVRIVPGGPERRTALGPGRSRAFRASGGVARNGQPGASDTRLPRKFGNVASACCQHRSPALYRDSCVSHPGCEQMRPSLPPRLDGGGSLPGRVPFIARLLVEDSAHAGTGFAGRRALSPQGTRARAPRGRARARGPAPLGTRTSPGGRPSACAGSPSDRYTGHT